MRKRKGVTLIELIAAIVLIGIVVYSALAIFVTSGFRGMDVEVYTMAQLLAEDKLEEQMTRDFEWLSSEAQTTFSGDLSAYSYAVTVDYVSSEALDTVVGGTSDHKRVRVNIYHAQLGMPVSLESIRVNY